MAKGLVGGDLAVSERGPDNQPDWTLLRVPTCECCDIHRRAQRSENSAQHLLLRAWIWRLDRSHAVWAASYRSRSAAMALLSRVGGSVRACRSGYGIRDCIIRQLSRNSLRRGSLLSIARSRGHAGSEV